MCFCSKVKGVYLVYCGLRLYKQLLVHIRGSLNVKLQVRFEGKNRLGVLVIALTIARSVCRNRYCLMESNEFRCFSIFYLIPGPIPGSRGTSEPPSCTCLGVNFSGKRRRVRSRDSSKHCYQLLAAIYVFLNPRHFIPTHCKITYIARTHFEAVHRHMCPKRAYRDSKLKCHTT